MTKEYAAKMWSDYLMNLRKPDKKERIMTNPAIRLAQDVEEGRYADTPEEVFAMIRDSVSQERASSTGTGSRQPPMSSSSTL